MFTTPGSRDGRLRSRISVRSRTTTHTSNTALFDAATEITGFRQTWHVRRPGVATWNFKCEVMHRNLVTGVIAYSGRGYYRYGATPAAAAAGSLVGPDGAVGGGNIYDITDHYGNAVFNNSFAVVPGYYQFSVWMLSDTTTPHTSGTCAEISIGGPSNPYNAFTCTVIEGAVYG
jgi:hypothetical protein